MSNIIETLVVKIASDITEFQTGVSDALKGSAEFEQAISKIGNAGEGISKIGKAVSDVGEDLTKKLTAPIAGLVTASVKSYADLEQLMGGVETLFKDSYDKVIKNSETAFVRAGMTQNQYLDNVMAFSSRLLQGLGGDTEEAARLADMAMTDISDNANKFGSSIESVQNAYQGFAKANYTMLDNLKLGYGGTKEEMLRLLADAEKLSGVKYDIENFDDIINAIHVIQDDLNITGTTAFEATTTISGSFAMAKNSVLDFLSNLGNADADMEVFKENMINAVKVLVENIKTVLATIWENIPLKGWQKNLLAAAAAAGPILIVIGKITSGVGGLMTAFSKIASFQPLLAKVGTALSGLAGPVGIAIAAVAALVAIFIGLYNTNEEFREKIQTIWAEISAFLSAAFEGIKTVAENIFNGLKEFWDTWGADILAALSAIWDGIGAAFNLALDGLILIAEVIFNGLKDFWDTWGADILEALSTIWETLKETFGAVLGTIIEVATGIFKGLKEFWDTWGADISEAFFSVLNTLQETFGSVFESVKNIVEGIFNGIKSFWDTWGTTILNVFKTAFNLIKSLVETVFNAIKTFWDTWGTTISTFFVGLWKMVCNAFETALNVLKNVFKVFEGIFTGDWRKAWEGVKGIITSILDGIKKHFKLIFDTLLSIAKDIFDKIKTAVSEKFEAVKTAITDILDKIKTMFSELPDKAIEWGKNLIEGFIDGIKAVAHKVKDTVEGVINSVADFLGFNSPAKKGEGRHIVHWGYNMIDGFLDGINQAAPLLNRTMKKVIPDMDNALSEMELGVTARNLPKGEILRKTAEASGSTQTEIVIKTEGLFKGAVLTVREEADIEKIARIVFEKLAEYLAQKNRNLGLQGV